MISNKPSSCRRECFINWYAWSLKYNDCDPSVWLTNYLNKRYEHNSEQRLWFSWLYGNTYQLPTAWILLNEFPDFELVSLSRTKAWNTENYKRLRYQTDTKWNKGHLPEMFASYKKFVGGMTQQEALSACLRDNEEDSFDCMWGALNKNLYKFGRYSVWFYMQHLYSTCSIPITPTSLMLSDYSGSRSHRNGLLLALDKEEMLDSNLTKGEYNYLEGEARSIMEEMKSRFKDLDELNYYTMETCLCSFKKIFRVKNGRYLGYYLDRQAEEILNAEGDGWAGIDWGVLWQAREECLDSRLATKTPINKNKFSTFLETGRLDRLDWMFAVDFKIGIEAFL